LFDQHPGVQGDLELVSQHAGEFGFGRGCEQAGHHSGIGLENTDLGWKAPATFGAGLTRCVPANGLPVVEAVRPDRSTRRRPGHV
jgi:hypothetical protein